jgi:O-antigen ligase
MSYESPDWPGRVVLGLLAAYAFTVPWEYSLDTGEPLGNIARIVGLALLAVAIPAATLRLAQAGLRSPGWIPVLTLGLLLYFGLTTLWTLDEAITLAKLRGYFQEFMVVWILWEFAETAKELRWVMRAFVAGCGLLALLTLANFTSASAVAAEQIRFVAEGQDPNDVARFLDLGFALAALLVATERRWWERGLAGGYLAVGLLAVFLTASRGGLSGAAVAILGSLTLLVVHRKGVSVGLLAAGVTGAVGIGLVVPAGTLERLLTIPEQLSTGDLNERVNIWNSGWHAFTQAPWLGFGAGTFTLASGTAPYDTAHNTLLSVLVTGGLVAGSLLLCVMVAGASAVVPAKGPIRVALATTLAVWVVTSMVGAVEENRTTWLIFGLLAVAGRLAEEDPRGLLEVFTRRRTGRAADRVGQQ